MRRSPALTPAVCLLALAALTACTDTAGGSDGSAETVEDLAEEGLTGLALLHRGFEGGDPETDQVLVFHDPATGQPLHLIALPDGAVDPMASSVPVHSQFSEDWTFFAYATTEPNAVNVAVLTDPEETDVEEISYQPVETVTPAAGEILSQPVIHGDRLWFVSDTEQGGAPPQVLSVPLDAPTGTPNQEGSLALGEAQRPSDWALTPDGALHIRNSVQTQQMNAPGGGSLVVRQTDGSVVNATLNVDGGQWQTFDGAQVWGEGTAVLRPDAVAGADASPGAYLVAVEGQSHEATRLLEEADGPVVQYAPAPGRESVLLQTEEAWFRVDLADGAVEETAEAFPRFHDASMDGWPLAVRWATEPVSGGTEADPSGDPSGSPSS
ncbi:hypothetical protein ACFWTE_04370 [Nocardiopsis sp. NPDC058631]|uniref:hypothetical protein n=1 Tax=Nocardiopsis sp. NPDC058631 TaxID=3346566 RepID=UPI00364B6C5B